MQQQRRQQDDDEEDAKCDAATSRFSRRRLSWRGIPCTLARSPSGTQHAQKMHPWFLLFLVFAPTHPSKTQKRKKERKHTCAAPRQAGWAGRGRERVQRRKTGTSESTSCDCTTLLRTTTGSSCKSAKAIGTVPTTG